MRKKTRYERVRDQHSRIWRKRNARRARQRRFCNRATNARSKFRGSNAPPKKMSLLEQWVYMGIQKAKMLAARKHEQVAPTQIPQKVMQRRGA